MATAERMNLPCNSVCNRTVMEKIDEVIRGVSPYYLAYKSVKELEEEERRKAEQEGKPIPQVRMYIGNDNKKDLRKYNAPTITTEIPIFATGAEEEEAPGDHYVSVHCRGTGLHNVPYGNPCLDPMVYPLLFPHGDFGYSFNIFRTLTNATVDVNLPGPSGHNQPPQGSVNARADLEAGWNLSAEACLFSRPTLHCLLPRHI